MLLLISQLIAAAVYWTMFGCMMVKGRKHLPLKCLAFLEKLELEEPM